MSKFYSENRSWLIQTAAALLFFVLPFVGAVLLLDQENAVHWRHEGLTGIDVRGLAIGSRDERSVIYAAGNEEGIFRSDDGVHWQYINDGLPLETLDGITIHTLVINPNDSNQVYVLVSNDSSAVQLYHTTNGGDNWRRLTLPSSENFNALALFASEPPALYLLGSNVLYVSYDDGQSWTRRDTVPQDAQAQTLAVDPLSPGILYLGTQGQGILRSEDEGRSWTYSQNNLDEQPIQQLFINPTNPHILFALAEQKLYRSFDAGQTWEFTGQELQTQQITSLAVHPEQESVIYVGTVEGQVFVTANNGYSWATLGPRLKNTSVQALALDRSSVRVATDDGLQVLNLELPPDVTPATAVANLPSATPTNTPSPTPTTIPTPVATAAPTATDAPTSTPTPTNTNTPTLTPTNTPAPTPTDTAAPTATRVPPTFTPQPTPTFTNTPLPPPTNTPVPPPTNTPVPTDTPAPRPTSFNTPTPSITPTPTDTPTPTSTPNLTPATPTNTPGGGRPTLPAISPTPTLAPTFTPTITPTLTPTITPTSAPAINPTLTPTFAPTLTPTITPTITPTPSTPESNLINLPATIEHKATAQTINVVTLYANLPGVHTKNAMPASRQELNA